MTFVETQIAQAQIGRLLEDERFAAPQGTLISPSEPLPEKSKPCVQSWLRTLAGVPWVVFRYASWVVLLAVVAAIPIVNLYALGVLLEIQGRAARGTRWMIELPGLRAASRIGTVALGVWLWIMPLRLLASYARDAHLIDAGSQIDARLQGALNLAQVLVGVHLILAILAGGRAWNLLNPVVNPIRLWKRWRTGENCANWEQAICELRSQVQPRHYFVRGLFGFLGAAIWLVPPTILFAAPDKPEGPAFLVMLTGGLLLACVLTWLPVLQSQFAAQEQFRGYFQLRQARERLARRPGLWALGLLLIFALGLPLYLFKIFALPQDAMWLVTLIYVASVVPTKLLAGWLTRSSAAGRRAPWYWRMPMYTLQYAVCLTFVFLIFFTQNIAQDGKAALFKQHLFVLPF